jgi:S-DNA-T family DNA segregation ATPase FtsK/SpoIIIE
VVVFDDIDSVLRRFDPEYQAELVADLAMILRDGPGHGIVLVASAQRLAAPVAALAPLFPERIHLRFASRQEYIVAEGSAGDHDPNLPPGAGHWRGTRLQVALAPPMPRGEAPLPPRRRLECPSAPEVLLVVASRPTLYFDTVRRIAPEGVRLLDVADRAAVSSFSVQTDERVWIVGSPDAWTAAWNTFSALRAVIPVLFDSCSLSDFRSLTRRRDLPPPVEHGRRARWLVSPDGTTARFAPSDLFDS